MSFIISLMITADLYLMSYSFTACEDINFSTNNHFCRLNDTGACNSSLEICSSWCKGVQWSYWSVINADLGHVKFTLLPAPLSCCHVSYEISLKLSKDKHCLNKNYGCVHSTRTVTKEDCSNINCTDCEVIEFDVKYVFSNWYYLEISAFTRFSRNYCSSDSVHIETNYNKTLIGNGALSISPPVYRKSDILYTAINFGIPYRLASYPNTIMVRLNSGIDISSDDCSNTGKREACCLTGKHINDCCKRGYSQPNNCSCNWVDESLMCYFSNINAGNYCLHIELSDLRCDIHSLWATESDCVWHHSFTVLPPANLTYTPAVFNIKDYSVLWTLLLIFLMAILVTIVILCVYFKPYPKQIYHRYVSCEPTRRTYQLSTLDKPRVLLLYPRDCEPFKSAMRNFRHLLQEFLEVHDMWDEDNWEDVNEVGPQWAIKFISDKTIKVIIIASPLSLKFEQALINRNMIKYNGMPDCLDSVFFCSFKEVVSTANLSTDNYNRFFVVRLDEPNCEENKFITITPCRTYTIPQHLNDFTLQIQNMNPGGIILNSKESSKIYNLTMSIAELRNFKLNSPNYLTELIEVVKESC